MLLSNLEAQANASAICQLPKLFEVNIYMLYIYIYRDICQAFLLVCVLYIQPRLILYADEVSPGNQLRHEATRKVQILYWGIKCAAGMSVDQLWFTLGVARSSIVSALQGGMSGLCEKSIATLFRAHQHAPWGPAASAQPSVHQVCQIWHVSCRRSRAEGSL